MKILYIITQADGGGAQNYVLALASRFKGAVAAGSESDKLFSDAESNGLMTFRLKHLRRDISPWHDLLAVFEIARLIKTEQPDIVHLNSTKAGFLGSLAAGWLKLYSSLSSLPRRQAGDRKKVRNVKIVFTAHGFRHLEPLSPLARWFYFWAEKLASKFRDYIIAVSEADRRSAIEGKIISSNKISTIYNGIPQLKFLAKDEARAQLKIPQNVIVLGNTSNFYPTKGQDILIESAALLPKEILDKVLFVIFGSGPEFLNLKSKITHLKLDASFRLFGQVPNARQYLKALDIFVLPSRKEGFPYGILEAMQAGLPIPAFGVGGVPEALGDAGTLIQAGNVKDLARSIIQLVQRPELRNGLSIKAMGRSGLFTEERMLRETSGIYHLLVKNTAA